MVIVITGVSRGIGLALLKEALQKNHQVFGLARNPQDSAELSALKKQYPSLSLIHVDLCDEKAAEKINQALSGVEALDVLINNAGVLENGTSKEDFLKSFTINSYVPFMVTQALIPKLKKSAEPKVIHVTSQMGSIEDNGSGGYYAYRSSKAALNMIHKSLTLDHPWLKCMVIHPGWVQTRMGGEGAPTPAEESAKGIWKQIDDLQVSGVFKDFKGKSIPW